MIRYDTKIISLLINLDITSLGDEAVEETQIRSKEAEDNLIDLLNRGYKLLSSTPVSVDGYASITYVVRKEEVVNES